MNNRQISPTLPKGLQQQIKIRDKMNADGLNPKWSQNNVLHVEDFYYQSIGTTCSDKMYLVCLPATVEAA